MRSSLIRYLFWRIALVVAICWVSWLLNDYGILVLGLLILFNFNRK